MEATETHSIPTEQAGEETTGSVDLTEALKKLRDEVDNLNLDLTVEKARDWVREHPVLATGAALGVGLIAAAVVMSMLEEDEPESRRERISREVRSQVDRAGRSLQRTAHDLRQDLGEKAESMSQNLMDSMEPVLESEQLSKLRSRGQKVSTSVTETIKAAAAAAVVQKISDWMRRYTR